jgi:nucleotide-binding universal stress UspA family protein
MHVLTVAPHEGSQFVLQNALNVSSQPEPIVLSEAEKAAEKAVQALGELPVKVEKSVRWGVAAREIVRTAGELQADMIVLGMKPHGLLRRLLLGHTGLQVLQATSATVLLARPYAANEVQTAVLLCLDGANFASAIRAMENLNLGPDTRIHLAGFIEPPRLAPGVLPSYSEADRAQSRGDREARRHTLTTAFDDAESALALPGRKIERLIAEERLEAGLKKLTDDIQPSLIIIGAPPLGGFYSSTTEAATVASLASCSVLVAR